MLGMLRSAVIVLLILTCGLWLRAEAACARDGSLVEPSLTGDDHVSEGVLLNIGGERLVHVFRLDPGLRGHHASNGGRIGIRKSLDGGRTWSQPEQIDPSPYDDRNIAGFVRDGEIELAFRQYDARDRVGLGLYWINTLGSGWFWQNSVLKLPLAYPGRTAIAPDAIAHVPGIGWMALLYNSADGSHFLLTSPDGLSWDFVAARQLPAPAELRLSEGALEHIGDGRLIAVFRNERRRPGYHVMASADGGATWSAPVQLAGLRHWMSAPHILREPNDGTVYLLGGERIAPDGDEANRACAIVILRSTCERLAIDPTDWDHFGSVPRPWPSAHALYGYPTAAPRGDGTHLVIFTDRTRDADGTEGANLFQFVLEDAAGLPPSVMLTASVPPTVPALAPLVVTGRARGADGAPAPGIECLVQRRSPSGRWLTETTVTSGADGSWKTTVVVGQKSAWRVIAQPNGYGHTAGYGPLTVTPLLALSRPSVQPSVPVGTVRTVTGTITPVATSGPVYLAIERKKGSSWVLWRRDRVRLFPGAGGVTRIRKSLVLPARGPWRIRFEHPENASHGRSLSSYRYVRAY